MDWRSRKQIIFGGILLLILIIVIGLPTFLKLRTDPTCFDGNHNGDEDGIDCGGSCERACSSEVLDPVIFWARSFKVTDGIYNATSLIENSNRGVSAQDVPYTFKLFDSENILVFERKGLVDIPTATSFVVFEDSIFTGERIPQTTFFEFTGDFNWLNKEFSAPGLKVSERLVEEVETGERVRATIENTSVNDYHDIEVVIVVFDINDNAIASSKTFLEELPKRTEKEIVFTWPQNFETPSARIEIFPKIDSE